MKRISTILAGMAMVLTTVGNLWAQKVDDARMERDIEVAENILTTIIKQQFEEQRMFFPLNISGSYQPGFGITFRLPADYTTPIAFVYGQQGGSFYIDSSPRIATTFPSRDGAPDGEVQVTGRGTAPAKKDDIRLRTKSELNMDSVRDAYNVKVIQAAKIFLADYGDLLSQLPATEKIMITNQGEQSRQWLGRVMSAPKRTHLSLEATKADLVQYKQGKFSRDQMMARIKVVNTESVDEAAPDLELLSSIFSRLFRPDLSKTYFAEDYIYFEQLKDFGVIYYMNVYSSNRMGVDGLSMPTLGLDNLSQQERDKKVTELYPQFEKEMKENILDYGRTVKSLKDEEMLVVNVKLTRCEGCGIPSTAEFSIKAGDLKSYDAGKLDKNAALSRINIKKGPQQ